MKCLNRSRISLAVSRSSRSTPKSSTAHEASVLLPCLYGIGTALPVVVFSVVIAFVTNRVSRVFNALTKIEPWMRRITAAVFILVGGYYCLVYLFGVL